jgi:tetratricopeptide (TPR) repeat protein
MMKGKPLLPFALVLLALAVFVCIHFRYVRVRQAEGSLYATTRYLDRSEFAQAQQAIENAVSISPQNAHYLGTEALVQERMLQWRFDINQLQRPELNADQKTHVENAIRYYQAVLKLNPNDDFVYHNLGWLYWYMQQKQLAIESLRKAISIDFSVPLYHVSLGLVDEFSGDMTGAREEYSESLQQSPGLLDSRFFIDLQRRSPAEAEQIVKDATANLEKELAKGNNSILKARLGKLYLTREPEKALSLLKDASASLPSLYRSWFNLGQAYELTGDQERMRQSYEKSVFVNRLEVQPLFRLGKYHDDRQNVQQAISYYRQALSGRLSQFSVHASRIRRIYLSNFTVHDDVIPNGMFLYISPDFDVVWTCNRLAELYQQTGNEQQATYYRELMNGTARKLILAP